MRRLLFAAVLSALLLLQIFQFGRPSQAITNNGSITTFGTPLSENFNTLASSGTSVAWTDNVTIPGWYAQFSASGQTSNPTTYIADSGTSVTGGIHSYGTTSADRALGSVGSNTTGDLYHAVKLTNNTGATITSLDISYTGEQWRNGGNASAQQLDFQYQVAGSGTITDANTPSSGWTDFDALDFVSPVTGTTATQLDGNAAANRTAKSATLSVTVNAGQEIWLRWKDTNDAGNDHGLAIDDFSVTAHGAGATNPSGVGASNPSTVLADGASTTLLTVSVTPGTSPISTGLAVTANLTPIGGAASQQFYDDGTHGDVTAGDNVFSFTTTVASGTSGGSKSMTATVTDAQSRAGSATIPLTVLAPTPPSGTGTASPNAVQAGGSSLLTVAVTPGSNPTSTGLAVRANLSSIGGSPTQSFFDDGTNGDVTAGDNVFSFQATVAANTGAGAKSLPATITDAQSRTGTATISLNVSPSPPPTTIKVSQVYGGGGNSGSTYTNDFIEIYNQGPTPIDLSNWSVQYQSAGSTGAWQVTNLCPANQTCAVQPGHYYLIQEAQGTGGTTPLPAPDATGSIAMSATSAKVALVNSTIALNTPSGGGCPAPGSIADLVGYGSPNCSEASPTSTLSATSAAVRRGNGCVDTDNNANDFVTIGPIPRNSSSPANSCGGDPTQPSGLGLASPASLDPASNTLLTVKVAPATTPPSTDITVNADLTSIGGSSTQQFYDDGTNGDTTAGDNVFSFQTTVAPNITTGVKSIVATITDGQARIATAPITLTVQSLTCGVERWSVKVGTDPDVSLVDLNNPVHTTIQALSALTPPANPPGPPDNSRVQPTESTVYVIDATMTFYKKESDVDYHIVIQDDTGHTMIAEIPSPACVLTPTSPRQLVSGPFSGGIMSAREKFDARFKAETFFQTANVPVRVKGVAFFDFLHGQNGVAPNGIELHPLLDIDFTANTMTTLLSSSNPSQYNQQVLITATVSNNGAAPTPTGNVTFFDGANAIDVEPLDQNGQATFTSHTLSVGSHSITASYEGDDGSAPSTTSTALVQVVNKADQTIDFAPLAAKTYGDPDFALSATASSGLPVSFAILSGPATVSGNTVHITGAGTVTVRATQDGDSNYNAAPNCDRSFEVAKADQTINFAPLADKTYGDAPFAVSATGGGSTSPVTFSASGNCTSGGTNGATITINGAGPCMVTASQAGDSNYNAAPAVSRSFTVNQAAANIVVNGYSGVYDGHAHGATGTATGVGDEDLSALLNFGSAFTNVPGGTANWTFAGNNNYAPASGTAQVVITQASASITVNGYTGIYDGNAHGATGSASGVGGEDLTSLLNLGASFTDVPGGTANWAFAGNTNYAAASGTAAITITQAAASIAVNGYTGVYDGNAHSATGSATGVKGEDLRILLDLGASFTNVPGGTANWTFAGNTDYQAASGTASIVITKAMPTVTWNNPADITYGTALGASQLNATASVPGSFAYTPAAGTVLNAGGGQTLSLSFAPTDATNYSPATKVVTINVLKAAPSFSNLSSPSITYGTAATTLSGKLSFGSLIPTGSVAITLNGVTQNAAIQAGGSFSSSFATASLPPTNPPYSIAYSYGGDSNFNPASGAGTLTVGYNIVALYDQTAVHNSGSTIPIKLAITNAAGNNLSSSNTAVTAVGIALISTTVYGPVEDAGNANPDGNFRFDGDSYIFNLQTTGLATGVYNLYFRVGADPTLHTVQFQVK